MLQAGEVGEDAVTIDGNRLAASRCDLVAPELRRLPGRQIFFTDSFGVTSKIGNFLSLLQIGVLFLVVLTASLCALVVFVSILQQKSTEVQKRLLRHLHFHSNSMTPKIIRRQSIHRFFHCVCSRFNQFEQWIQECVSYHC